MQENDQRPALRVGLVQFKPLKPRVAENLARVQSLVGSAAGTHDLLVFPEAALSGYFIEGGVVEAALSTEAVATGLGEASPTHPYVVLGFYERWRDRLYNSIGH